MELSVTDLVLASALPVLEIVILCFVGALLVWKGMMSPEGRTLVTKLTYYVFFPSLVVTALGTSVTLETLQSWWPVPVSTLLNVLLGMIIGLAVFPFVGMEPHLKPHFVSCAAAGNLGNLLIVLIPSIASKASTFTDQDGEDGLAYVFTGLFAICIAVFTCVGFMLELPKQQHARATPEKQPSPPSSPHPAPRSERGKVGHENPVYDLADSDAQSPVSVKRTVHSNMVCGRQNADRTAHGFTSPAATSSHQEAVVVYMHSHPIDGAVSMSTNSQGSSSMYTMAVESPPTRQIPAVGPVAEAFQIGDSYRGRGGRQRPVQPERHYCSTGGLKQGYGCGAGVERSNTRHSSHEQLRFSTHDLTGRMHVEQGSRCRSLSGTLIRSQCTADEVAGCSAHMHSSAAEREVPSSATGSLAVAHVRHYSCTEASSPTHPSVQQAGQMSAAAVADGAGWSCTQVGKLPPKFGHDARFLGESATYRNGFRQRRANVQHAHKPEADAGSMRTAAGDAPGAARGWLCALGSTVPARRGACTYPRSAAVGECLSRSTHSPDECNEVDEVQCDEIQMVPWDAREQPLNEAEVQSELHQETQTPNWCTTALKIVRGLVNVPTVAIVVGLFIACTPVLRQLFFGPDEDEDSDGEDEQKGHLDLITSALTRLGAAAIPCMMLGIGGALSRGPGDAKVSWRAILALIVIRLIILPAVGGWAVLAAARARLWKDNGKMFTLVLTLQQAMPTALNVHTMASVHKNNEKVVAAILFWQYLACIVTIPICVLIFLPQIS